MSFFTESNMATSAYELETLEALLGKCLFLLLCWGNLSKSYKPPKVFPISRDMVVLSRPRYKVFVISKGPGGRLAYCVFNPDAKILHVHSYSLQNLTNS